MPEKKLYLFKRVRFFLFVQKQIVSQGWVVTIYSKLDIEAQKSD